MRSQPDRTAKATIRDEAMRLFAARGADAVTVREIAAAASVSPALIIQHYGSKDGLRAAVDAHVLSLLDSVIATVTGRESHDAEAAAPIVASAAGAFPAGSPLPGYLGRMLIEGGAAGRELFRGMLQAAREGLDAMVAAGRAAPGTDPAARAAFLLLNDLAVIVFHDLVRDATGLDPLTTDGMARWGREVLAIYGRGLAATCEEGTS